MKNFRIVLFAVLTLVVLSVSAFAQPGAAGSADNQSTVDSYYNLSNALIMIGFAIAAGLGAIGQSRIGASAVEGAARNPSAAGRIQTMMILGLALIESLVLFALLIAFTRGLK